MTADEIVLERRDLIVANMNIGELAESRGNAVYGAVLVDNRFDNMARPRHLVRSIRVKSNASPMKRHLIDVINGERLTIDQQRIHLLMIFERSVWLCSAVRSPCA